MSCLADKRHGWTDHSGCCAVCGETPAGKNCDRGFHHAAAAAAARREDPSVWAASPTTSKDGAVLAGDE